LPTKHSNLDINKDKITVQGLLVHRHSTSAAVALFRWCYASARLVWPLSCEANTAHRRSNVLKIARLQKLRSKVEFAN